MKVGLVPLLYDEYNYGGVLQFYALQEILIQNNIETEIIYFDNDEKICDSDFAVNNGILSRGKQALVRIWDSYNRTLIKRKLKDRWENIKCFKQKYYSPLIDSRNVKWSEYAAVICGSDQIWNPQSARKRSFLKYVPDDVNKVIYAASMGTDKLSINEKKVFKPAIERLQHISVREYSAKEILDEFIVEKNISVVLDPTLLLSAGDWMKITKPCLYNKYIFTYFLGEYADKIDYIKQFAKEKGLKIINVPFASGEKIDRNRFGDYRVIEADPCAFLGLIAGAEYIFTDSFHACVFSVLFHKQFFVFRRDNSEKMYCRIETLIKHFSLPDRCVSVETPIWKSPKIDFDNVEFIQKEIREKSLDYLFGSINYDKAQS